MRVNLHKMSPINNKIERDPHKKDNSARLA